MIQEFKDFINNGNIVDAAVGLIMALAFVPVVTAFVDGILMQIVAAIFGKPDFSGLTLGIGDAELQWGLVVTEFISFLGIAAAVFMVVKGYNAMRAKDGAVDGPSEVDLLTEIRDNLAK